jgi:phosphatidylserine/phosphatidylglycerophosphate/cardiolipin synthase-like enzyme
VKVYFNHDVDGNYSTGAYPNGTTSASVEAAILERITKATTSIDIAMYNINRTSIVSALTDAFNRGVEVRYIADNETANLALSNPTPPFNIIRGNSDGLMHNKFLAIDRNSINDSWLIMGSTNFTEQNLASDYNNILFIQDQALVKAYTVEFQEMWGSEGQTPGIFNVKFGPEKTDNTPHKFSVNGMDVESYFSPSDNTTLAIVDNINKADQDLNFALLTFTNNELGTAVLNANNRGVDVRGIIDNINDTGSEYNYLFDRGVNVTADFTTKSTHHKYCIIDTDDENSDPVLITGSHNWSGGADTRNDENTLIFHDDVLTNIFKQEFEARWCEAQGGTSCITGLENDTNIEGIDLQMYPNPAHVFVNLEFDIDKKSDIVVQLLNSKGGLISAEIFRNKSQSFNHTYQTSHLPSGHYYFRIINDNKSMVKRLMVVR